MCVVAIIPASIILSSPSRPMLRHSVKPASWRTVEKPLTLEESIHNIASINIVYNVCLHGMSCIKTMLAQGVGVACTDMTIIQGIDCAQPTHTV